LKLISLINDKLVCPNRKKKTTDIETCKQCSWFAGRTPLKNKIYVKCGFRDELIE